MPPPAAPLPRPLRGRDTLPSLLRSVALLLLLTTMALPRLAAAQPDAAAWAALQPDGIVLFRHAEAPGVSDPPQMRLGDCRTQRNLDGSGRAQARRIGERFRARGVRVGAVLSSQWCRTRDTAELAFPGQARDEPAFNSFFGDSDRRTAQTDAARALLLRWRGPGVLVVVTHQVNISALTGIDAGSADGVVVRAAAGGLEVLGRLPGE